MSGSKIEMKDDGFSGRVVFGTVTKVLPYGAYLRLDGMTEVGNLNISQVSVERIDPPLTNTLKEGDRIEVLVKWFDEVHQRWDTSHKAIIQQQQWESSGLTTLGTRVSARILKAGELGAVVDMGVITGTILGGTTYAWNAYNVLYQAGYLMPDESIDVVVNGWDAAKARPKLRLYIGEPLTLARGTSCYGKVIFIRKNVVVNTSMYDDLYARLAGGGIAWVHLNDMIAVERTFPLGASIPLILGKHLHSFGMLEAKIDWDRTNIQAHVKPEFGTVVDAKVTALRPFGAICLIADRVRGLLHHSKFDQEKSGDTLRHLRLGDVVRVIVEQPDVSGRNVLRFLQLVDGVETGSE